MPATARWQLAVAVVLMAAPAALSWRATNPAPSGQSPASSAADHAARPDTALLIQSARDALAAAKATHGAESPQAAAALDTLVTALLGPGGDVPLPEIHLLAERSIHHWTRLTGDAGPGLAFALTNEAEVLIRLEEFRAARQPADRALAIRMSDARTGPAELATSLYQGAELRRVTGDFAGACDLHERAIASWRSMPGRNGMYLQGIAASLHYLGVMKENMGDTAGATALIEESLAIRERLLTPRLDELAASLNFLGYLVLEQGDRERAMSLFARAQRLWEQDLGPRHGHVARSLANQAGLLMQAGDLAGARGLYERALAIRAQAFGPAHYLTARSLADLARLSARTGDLVQARDFFARALAIQRQDPEARGPELAETLIDDARLMLLTGDAAQALELALEAESLARENFLRTSRGLSEPEALRYETVRASGLDVALTELETRRAAGADIVGRVWDEAIRSRAMVLDEMAARHRKDGGALGASVPPRRADGLADVAKTLPDGSVVVAYLKYHRQPRRQGEAPGAAYMGFVLAAGSKAPAMVALGDASGIDRRIGEWRAQAGADPRTLPDRSAEPRCREAGRRLREAIWDPLARLVDGSRTVFIVPDGAIGLVSFAALPVGEDRYLIEQEPRITYLSAERDLIGMGRPPRPTRSVLALGGPAFDAPPVSAPPPVSPSAGPPGPGAFRSALPSCPAFTSLRFVPLPASMREADDVESFWKSRAVVLRLTGPGATEAALKQAAPGADLLHLATHGYYLKDGCSPPRPGAGTYGPAAAPADNPLLMTGLALAGANHRGQAGRDADDGIMTAEEIGALDLSGVRWAVLSGCETGIGPVMDGEGVLGLRRAFQVAGAGSLIMTLWPVDDGATRLWMNQLYEGRLAGLSTVDAVSQAGLRMLQRQRAAAHGGHPYYWGGFVSAGEWR